ncbi:hypothetical protein V5799_020040 [Amblyomma americanum]|uniref:Uncharacterized protein n=1 Tax=Amblyomma americanum TaxID=6943 RepID=A0AAQ4EVK1_AMBAM
MPYSLRMVRPTSARFFSSWSDEERLFLRNLLKRYACSKVYLMQKLKTSPNRRSDCGRWPMWAVMANKLRDGLGKDVEPRTLEAFFWYVIARGADQRSVNSRLDLLVLRNVSLSQEETDDSEDSASSDSEQNYSDYSPSEDEGSSTDSEQPRARRRSVARAQPLEPPQASASTQAGKALVALAPRLRADCAIGTALLVAPKVAQWYAQTHHPNVVLCGPIRSSAIPTAPAQTADGRRGPLMIAPVSEAGEGRHAPAREQDLPRVCSEVHELSAAVEELRFEDGQVCTNNEDSGGRTGLCTVRGDDDSFGPPTSTSGESDGGHSLEHSSSPCVSDGHHSDTDSPMDADDESSLVARADKEVQCDLHLTYWHDVLMTEMTLQATAMRRQKAFRDRQLAARNA